MGLIYSPQVTRQGLVINLDAADINSYPGSGTTWYDLSGNGNNASLVNGLAYTSVNKGEVFMDGGDEYIRIPPSSNLTSYFSTSSFTVETVVRSTNVTYPQSRHPFYVNGTVTSTPNRGWSVGHASSTSTLEVRVSDGTNISNTLIAHTVSEATPYHRVFTVDRAVGCVTKYYVNSLLYGTHNASTVVGSIYDGTTTDFETGVVLGYVWGWRYIGGVSLIRVYNRVLTLAEIQQNYNATKNRFGL